MSNVDIFPSSGVTLPIAQSDVSNLVSDLTNKANKDGSNIEVNTFKEALAIIAADIEPTVSEWTAFSNQLAS